MENTATDTAIQDRARLPRVGEVPAACPSCGSFNRDLYGSRAQPDMMMRLEDGRFHRGFVLRYAECGDCRRRYVVKAPILEKHAISDKA